MRSSFLRTALGISVLSLSIVSAAYAVDATDILNTILDGIAPTTETPSVSVPNVAAMKPNEAAPDRIIVKYKEGSSETLRQQILQRVNAQVLQRLNLIEGDLVRVPAGKSIQETLAKFKADPDVEYAEPDYVVHTTALSNDPYAGNLWGLENIGQNGGKPDADIDMPEAWQLYKPTASITVAVIDSGIDYTHPDLLPQMWVNNVEDVDKDGRFTTADLNRKDDDGNGYIDDVHGWDFVNGDNNPKDDNNHGTHVAGTINARGNNGIGVVGVAAKGSVKVMALKFTGATGSGYTSNAIKALEYATAKRALIANNSWGGSSYSQALFDAIKKYQTAGGLFVASAGNNGANTDAAPTYPAGYNLANIISVASMTSADGLSSFSNYGATSVDLGAPGSSIYSTLPGNRYGYMSGTSMAAPHVSGTAALLWSHRGSIGASQVKSILMNTVRKTSSLSGKTVTGGMVNAQSALSAQ